MVMMSPDGGEALMRLDSPILRLVHLDQHQDVWDLPCTPNAKAYDVTATWDVTRRICYLAEGEVLDAPGDCTGAWNLADQRLAWRAQDAAGQEVMAAVALVPDPSSHQVLLQCRLPGETGGPGHRFLTDWFVAEQNLLSCGMLDGASGRWLSALANPGRDPGFTPDGQRVVGMLGVVGIAANRLLQPFDLPISLQNRLYLSPSRTWMLYMPVSGDWQLRDCAQCGIVLHIQRPAAVPVRERITRVIWDASEQHCAIAFTLTACVYTLPLLPPAPASTPFDPAVLARLDASSGWLAAAQDLSGMGPAAVDALNRAPLSAHRLIALEMLARAGEHQADTLIDAAGSLPPPLGFLAHDCAFRIHALRTQHALAASATRPGSAP